MGKYAVLLPKWLYIQTESNSASAYQSTTAGEFSLDQAMKGSGKAFEAAIPSTLKPELDKKRLYLVDFSLPYLGEKETIYLIYTIELLIDEGFEIILFTTEGERLTLDSSYKGEKLIEPFYNICALTQEQIAKRELDFDLESCALLSYNTLRNIATEVLDGVNSYLLSENLDFLIDNVIPYCQSRKTTLKGHDLPSIHLDEVTEHTIRKIKTWIEWDKFKTGKSEYEELYDWGFNYQISEMDEAHFIESDPYFSYAHVDSLQLVIGEPLEKYLVAGLAFINKAGFMEFPGIKQLGIIDFQGVGKDSPVFEQKFSACLFPNLEELNLTYIKCSTLKKLLKNFNDVSSLKKIVLHSVCFDKEEVSGDWPLSKVRTLEIYSSRFKETKNLVDLLRSMPELERLRYDNDNESEEFHKALDEALGDFRFEKMILCDVPEVAKGAFIKRCPAGGLENKVKVDITRPDLCDTIHLENQRHIDFKLYPHLRFLDIQVPTILVGDSASGKICGLQLIISKDLEPKVWKHLFSKYPSLIKLGVVIDEGDTRRLESFFIECYELYKHNPQKLPLLWGLARGLSANHEPRRESKLICDILGVKPRFERRDYAQDDSSVGVAEDSEAQDDNFIYSSDSSKIMTDISVDDQSSSVYNKTQRCKILPGGYKFKHIRNAVFTIDFDTATVLDVQTKIVQPHFVDIIPRTTESATHEFLYKPVFNLDEKGIEYHHRMDSLSPTELLRDFDNNQLPSGCELRYSYSDHFYYLVSKNKPQDFVLHYTLRAFPAYPSDELTRLGTPFHKPYRDDPRPKSARSKDDIIAHPEYYVCSQRVMGFLYKYRNHPARFFGAFSDDHAWIECEGQVLDLGGGGNLTFSYRSSPLFQSSAVTTKTISSDRKNDSTLSEEKQVIKFLNQSACNTLWVVNNLGDLDKLRRFILNLRSDSVIVIDSPTDLSNSKDFIHLDAGKANLAKAPGGWLSEQLARGKVLLIDWSKFTARQAAQANSLIETPKNRTIQGLKLPEEYLVVGLILASDPLVNDASFRSRHFRKIYYFESMPLTFMQNITPSASASDVETIELYHSAQWFALMMGKVCLKEGKTVHEPGPIQTTKCRTLKIKNPPSSDPVFQRFIHALEDGTAIHYYDKNLKFERFKIIFSNGYDFTKYKDRIEGVHLNYSDLDLIDVDLDYILTPATFNRALADTYIDDQGIIHQGYGWLDNSKKEKLNLFLPQTLSNEQYCALLEKAKLVNLNLYCAPGVKLPDELLKIVSPMVKTESHNKQSVAVVNAEQVKKDDLIIDVTGLSPDDLLYGYSYEYKDQTFIFKEKVSEVLKALEVGRTVYLTGHFSHELIDHLSSLLTPHPKLWHQHTHKELKGKLFLCPENVDPYLNWVQNPRAFAQLNFEKPKVLHLSANEPNKGAKEFLQARCEALALMLKDKPAVFIEGEPGCGKSSFVRYLKNNPQYKLYSENQFQLWAEDSADVSRFSILVIDEATIRGSDWSIFQGLYTPYPHLLINGKVYYIQPHQKIIFLGNQLKNMPALFSKVSTLKFNRLSEDYLIEFILQPIFKDEEQAKIFYQQHSNLSARELQAEAINAVAEKFPAHVPTDNLKTFMMTGSRKPILDTLFTSLNIREVKLSHPEEAGQHGGHSGVWLEGPAASGKTQIITSVLKDFNYEEDLDYYELPASMEPETLLTKVRQAYQEGKLVIIHELDTFLNRAHPEYVAELNAYLMGEDLNMNRPKKPGFMLWATGNGGTYPGRMALPESLKSRMKCLTLLPFTYDECVTIVHKLYPQIDEKVYGPLINHHVNQAHLYSFREMLEDLRRLSPTPAVEHTGEVLKFTRIIPDYDENRRKPEDPDKPKI